MTETTKNYLLLHLVVVIFGFTGILGKLITIDAEQLVFWRAGIGGLVIMVWLALRGEITAKSPSTLLKMAGVGLIVAAHWITFFASIKASTVSVALVMFATAPMFVGIIEPIVFRRNIDPRELVISTIVLAGVGTIFSLDTDYQEGMILGIISAFLAATFATLNGVLVKQYDASNISMIELLSASIGTGIILIFSGEFNSEMIYLSSTNWLWITLLAVVATSFAFIVSTHVMKVLTPFTTAIAINLEPIYTIVIALIIFGEEEVMGPNFYLGASLIIGAVIINTIIKKK
ncbi:MAG: EamA family transporter [Crocinitomicaceae bacterium]|nr:EamA family transporter [Crocinitomicaceae bacterium]|tara:strand:+ start:3969 stop:4835 length:867 start_codon:yes stop_codon:yes gene_type:complete